MLMNERMDAGDILLQRKVAIAPHETAGELEERLGTVGADLLVETIRRLNEGSLTPVVQVEEQATYARSIRKEDGLMVWSKKAAELERMIRALNPWPSACTRLRGRLLKIHRARAVEFPASPDDGQLPGSVLEVTSHRWIVLTGRGGLSLEEVQFENKKKLAIADFLRGCHVHPGETLV
jgi:methionyl-tRNA formyltransferase